MNSNTMNDAWSLPRIVELWSRLKGAQVFCKLDLRGSSNQTPIDLLCKYETAFVYHFRAFKKIVMPFGLKNAPSHF